MFVWRPWELCRVAKGLTEAKATCKKKMFARTKKCRRDTLTGDNSPHHFIPMLRRALPSGSFATSVVQLIEKPSMSAAGGLFASVSTEFSEAMISIFFPPVFLFSVNRELIYI